MRANRITRRATLGSLAAAALPRMTYASAEATFAKYHIDVEVESNGFDLPRTALLDWVDRAARAVAAYYGQFPVPQARIRIRMAEGRRGVFNGRTFGEHGAFTTIAVGQHITAEELLDDWMMTHEMVHYAFPDMDEEHHWIEEGSATYVEPIARFQIGNLSAERVWGDMVRDMGQGLPEPGDQGLDNTHTWGRTYWGGALFCLLADVEIRKKTANRRGLQDALSAIDRAGGNITVDWPIERALETGDKVTGGSVLMDLYKRMANAPVNVDLADLWKQLGVSRADDVVKFQASAPLASVREAIQRGHGQ